MAYDGNAEIINALLKAGANIEIRVDSGATPLIIAATSGNDNAVNALLKAGANVNAKDNDGMTALMFAASFGRTETMNILIEAGADDAIDNYGKTALIIAASAKIYNADATINALIEAGSYVKQKDNSGKTALDYARENIYLKDKDALKRLEELSR